MVLNFHRLKDQLEPPLLVGHYGTPWDIGGWVVNLYATADGATLLADLDVTEPDVLERIERGTFRKISAEIYYGLPRMRGDRPPARRSCPSIARLSRMHGPPQVSRINPSAPSCTA